RANGRPPGRPFLLCPGPAVPSRGRTRASERRTASRGATQPPFVKRFVFSRLRDSRGLAPPSLSPSSNELTNPAGCMTRRTAMGLTRNGRTVGMALVLAATTAIAGMATPSPSGSVSFKSLGDYGKVTWTASVDGQPLVGYIYTARQPKGDVYVYYMVQIS